MALSAAVSEDDDDDDDDYSSKEDKKDTLLVENNSTTTTATNNVQQQQPLSLRDEDDDYYGTKLLWPRLLRPRQHKQEQTTTMMMSSGTSTTDLAYIGDVVYELFVRTRTVYPPRRTSELQQIVVGYVRAEFQSALLSKLKKEFPLTNIERQVLGRGRNNSSSSSSSRKNRKNPKAYQDSTSFEALIGYLYWTDIQRCNELLEWIDKNMDEIEAQQ